MNEVAGTGAGRVLARNTALNALGRVWEAALGLVLMAYAIRAAGEAAWGLWSLAGFFTGYVALFDVGLGSGFSKFIADRSVRGGIAGISAVVSAGFFFYLILSAAILVLGWPLVDALIGGILWLRPDAAAQGAPIEELRFMFRGALLLFAANTVVSPFLAVPVGLQRMGWSNAVGAACAGVKLLATVCFLERGLGAPGLLFGAVAAFVFQAAGGLAVAWHVAPGLRVSPRQWDCATWRQLFHFGWRAQVARLANVINFQTDRAVLWGMTGFGHTGLVGMYAVAESLAGKMRQLPGLLVSAMVPAASELDARGDRARLRELHVRSTKYMAAMTIPLTVYFLACAEMLVRLVAGARPDTSTAAWVTRILVLGYCFNLLPAPGISIVLGKGQAGLQMKAGLISMLANIALTIALAWQIGFYGIPAGTALGMLMSTMWFMWAARHELETPLGALCRQCLLWPLLASLAGGAACAGLQYGLRAQDGLLANAAGAAAGAAVLGVSYVVLLGRSPFFDYFDLVFMRDTLCLGRAPGFRLLTWRAHHD